MHRLCVLSQLAEMSKGRGFAQRSIPNRNIISHFALSTLSIVLLDILRYIMTALISWLRLLG